MWAITWMACCRIHPKEEQCTEEDGDHHVNGYEYNHPPRENWLYMSNSPIDKWDPGPGKYLRAVGACRSAIAARTVTPLWDLLDQQFQLRRWRRSRIFYTSTSSSDDDAAVGSSRSEVPARTVTPQWELLDSRPAVPARTVTPPSVRSISSSSQASIKVCHSYLDIQGEVSYHPVGILPMNFHVPDTAVPFSPHAESLSQHRQIRSTKDRNGARRDGVWIEHRAAHIDTCLGSKSEIGMTIPRKFATGPAIKDGDFLWFFFSSDQPLIRFPINLSTYTLTKAFRPPNPPKLSIFRPTKRDFIAVQSSLSKMHLSKVSIIKIRPAFIFSANWTNIPLSS